MNLLTEAMSGLGVGLWYLAAALLFEEMTFGGLIRLLMAPGPGSPRTGLRPRGGIRAHARLRLPFSLQQTQSPSRTRPLRSHPAASPAYLRPIWRCSRASSHAGSIYRSRRANFSHNVLPMLSRQNQGWNSRRTLVSRPSWRRSPATFVTWPGCDRLRPGTAPGDSRCSDDRSDGPRPSP